MNYQINIIGTKAKILVGMSLLVILLLIQVFTPGKVSAAYDGGRIIDDSVFLDAASMNHSQIQSFLSSRGSGLANMNFVLNCYGQDSKERQWYTSVGAPCDQSVSASHIIYYASQIYGVNPKVILSTMQKEQSLTTAPNPTSWQLNQAMGYACPTSGQCGGNSTFPYQIDSGTWVLRYHFERARGNMSWWNQSSSWTCGTEKNYYKPNLYPGQNVRFYDQNGTLYRTHFIANAATSSFYCYTPHAYNNPQGLYGRAPYGNTGMYYSGSYNFVYFFELWFGSTIGPEFSAELHSKSPYQVLESGTGRSMFIQYKNTGRAFWKDDKSTFPGYQPVRIATSGPINRGSEFRANNWLSSSRTTGTFAKVYESDGVTLSSEQHTVKPGQIARFEFTIHANTNIAGGVYRENFQPILEGAPGYNWNMNGESYLEVGVHKPRYEAKYHSQSSYPITSPSFSSNVFIQYRNSGDVEWYDDVSVPAGKYPVHLATSWPINRSSKFSDNWPTTARPSLVFSRVYESNGSTLAANQHVVLPGQIARFEFSLKNNENTGDGFYQEYFEPILEGAPGYNWNMGSSSWLGITIPRTENKAQYHSQSSYPSLARSGTGSNSFIQFRNSGNTRWYDDVSVPAGKYPVHLATSWPINRSSKFSDNWPTTARPSLVFSRVYESNGSTLAANQHVVLPGQIARFEFSLKAKSDQPIGFYQEYFEPILEGAPGYNWNMGSTPWLGINVTN